VKRSKQTQIENTVKNLEQLAATIPVTTSFYTNLIVSKTFRNEVKKALSWRQILCIH
jgi:hypothetical protein